jgi:hypothetical protein
VFDNAVAQNQVEKDQFSFWLNRDQDGDGVVDGGELVFGGVDGEALRRRARLGGFDEERLLAIRFG